MGGAVRYEGAPDVVAEIPLRVLPGGQGLDEGQHLHLEHLVDPAELRDGLGMFVHAEVHVGVVLVLYRAYRGALLSPPASCPAS